MKKIFKILIIIFLVFLFFGCDETQNENGAKALKNQVCFHPLPEGVEEFQEAEVYIGNNRLPLYSVLVNTSQVWTPDDYKRKASGVGYFELDGKVEVTVKLPYDINYKSKLRPLSAGIIPVANLEERSLTFEISSTGNYVLEINGDISRTIHFFVSEITKEKFKPDTEKYLYFEPGIHTKDNNSLIDQNNQITLTSNTTVFLAPGAVVRGRFYARDAEEIKILGKGIISGSTFERNARTGSATIPIDFNNCRNVHLSDFSILDPAGWAVNFYFIENSKIENLKIITSRSNGDGISIQSCKGITVDGCFVRSWDDGLVVKNYPRWENHSVHGETKNIVFSNCTLWTDLAQAMEIGYETVGKVMENIKFSNITVLHALHKPVISIHNGNNAEIKNVLWERITVEDASMGSGDAHGNDELIDFRVLYSENWSSQHTITSLGSIEDVVVKDVLILHGKKAPKITISGTYDKRDEYRTNHYVQNISLKNITYRNTILDENNIQLAIGNYVRNVTVVHDGKSLGAEFIFSKTPQELALYGDELIVGTSIYQ